MQAEYKGLVHNPRRPNLKQGEFSQKLIEAAGSPDHITFIN